MHVLHYDFNMAADGLEGKIMQVARMIVNAGRVSALTGAGISTESGIPDFRGPAGLWKRVDPSVATIDYFLANPDKYWEFHLGLVNSAMAARPNAAHIALAELESIGRLDCIITQNIDGLHQRAGNRNVIELHGTLATDTCMGCGKRYSWEGVKKMIEGGGLPPRCPACGSIIRPDVVLFNEQLSAEALNMAFKCSRECDLMLVLGSSLAVTPAAYLPETAKSYGAKVAIVNMEPTEMDYIADVIVLGKLGEVLPKIALHVRELMSRDQRTP